MTEDVTDLFEANLLDSLPIEKPESGYLLRPLRTTDYDKGKFHTEIDKETFLFLCRCLYIKWNIL